MFTNTSRQSGLLLAALAVILLGAFGAVIAGCSKTSGDGQKTAATTSQAASIYNERCPIMGDKVSPNTPASLTRQYKGHTIGFCCGMCPPKWDKMSDAQKDAALAKVTPKN